MRSLLLVFALGITLSACSDAPRGRWDVVAPIDVYADNDDVAPVAFSLAPGDICALGEQWSYQKVFRFKRVTCSKGEGWILTDTEFRYISDSN